MATRLFVLLAREEPVGVIFRRGPSNKVLLVRWNLSDDTFEAGQWLEGRIYEHRCDLSPRGDRLVYFAAKWNTPLATWTAVSRPPFLTALALWPKGDAWGGGGLFENRKTLALNHFASGCQLEDGFVLPRGFEVAQLPDAGRGEDWPIYTRRLLRDGWTQVQEGGATTHKDPRVSFKFERPEIWSRKCPTDARGALRVCTDGIDETNGSWHVRRAELERGTGAVDLGRIDWADWSANGDLLLAREGKIRRVPAASLDAADVWGAARQLVDLSPLTFEAREAPPEARWWSGPAPPALPVAS
jgi:hypothetical protein